MPHQIALEQERTQVSAFAMTASLGAAVFGFLLAGLLYLLKPRRVLQTTSSSFTVEPTPTTTLSKIFRPLYLFSQQGWYIDKIYDYVIVGTFLLMARAVIWADDNILDRIVNLAASVTVFAARLVGWFDKYVVDGIVTLTGATIQFLGLMVRSLQTGRIQTYLAWIVAGVVILFVVVRYIVMVGP